jgi:hypothetical protein
MRGKVRTLEARRRAGAQRKAHAQTGVKLARGWNRFMPPRGCELRTNRKTSGRGLFVAARATYRRRRNDTGFYLLTLE